jgi:hypothetical protein
LAELGEAMPFRFAVPFIGIIYCIGFYGFSQVCHVGSACGAEGPVLNFLNNALRAFALFFSLAEPGGEALNNWWLMVARWIAPCITFFALFRIFFDRFEAWRKLRRLFGLKGHSIIVGFGDEARSVLQADSPTVIVDRKPATLNGIKPNKSLYTLLGDGRDVKTLNRAALRHAKYLLITGGSDTENLEMLSTVNTLRKDSKGELKIAIRLNNAALADQLNREDQFSHPSSTLSVHAIHLDKLAARKFLSDYPISDDADLRMQDSAHLVIVGWSGFSAAVIEQWVRLSPYKSLGVAHISLFCTHIEDVKAALHNNKPALMDRSLVEIDFYALDSGTQIPSDRQIMKLNDVTAIVVTHDKDETCAVAAMALRKKTQSLSFWKAPIYVRLKKSTELETMFQQKFTTEFDPARTIITVGQVHSSLNFDALFGKRDEVAKAFHDAYLKDKIGHTPSNSRTDQDWSQLSQTYRRSNYAAADHAPLKLLSSGFMPMARSQVPHGDWSIASDAKSVEIQAKLVHRVWEIDRRLEGWRFGKVRDDEQLIHPELKPYEQLSESFKNMDRVQVQLLARLMKDGDQAVNVLPDVVISTLGHNQISGNEEAEVARKAIEKFHALIPMLKNSFVSVATPLAPGSDTIIAGSIVKELVANHIPFRLLLLQALPWAVVRDECTLQSGGNAAMIETARAKVLEACGSSLRVIHLEPEGLSLADWQQRPALRIAAYRKANAWMASRSQHVIYYLRDKQKVKPGGTAECIAKMSGAQIKLHRL